MDSGHKWSWKDLENAHTKVLETWKTTLGVLYALCYFYCESYCNSFRVLTLLVEQKEGYPVC